MKRLTVLILVVVLVLGLMVSMIGAKGPANKATGSIWLYREDLPNDEFYTEFNAHEGIKGKIEWYKNGEFRFELAVVCCHVIEGVAWFAVGPLVSNGKYLVFKVVDGGTPGNNGDTVSLEWVPNFTIACEWVDSATDSFNGYSLYTGYTITGGNLVVHFY